MYLFLKLIHVFGVVLFLGNITVGVLWKRAADLSRNAVVMAYTMDSIIKADRVFTIPGIVILLIGGIGAALVGGIPILSTGWLLWGIVAFIISGIAFGPLSRVQRQISAAAHRGDMADYERLSRGWNLWGTVALIFPFFAFALMILKPAVPAFHR